MLASADEAAKLALIRAHPDLAGRAAIAGDLTDASKSEQAGAGLDRCTPEEYRRFQELNDAYKAKFGFPFILAVAGKTRHDILAAFEARIGNDRDDGVPHRARGDRQDRADQAGGAGTIGQSTPARSTSRRPSRQATP